MNIYELLDFLRRRPAMYIWHNSVTHLRVFVDGYFFCQSPTGSNLSTEQPDFFGGFNHWVADELGFDGTSSGWAGMIATRSIVPEHGLWLFYQLLDKYRGFHPRTLMEVEFKIPVLSTVRNGSLGSGSWSESHSNRIQFAKITIEEVLPAQDWVQLIVRVGNNIIELDSADNVVLAIEKAHEKFGVTTQDWSVPNH